MFSLAKALFYIVGILFGLHCAISLDFSSAANMRVSAVCLCASGQVFPFITFLPGILGMLEFGGRWRALANTHEWRKCFAAQETCRSCSFLCACVGFLMLVPLTLTNTLAHIRARCAQQMFSMKCSNCLLLRFHSFISSPPPLLLTHKPFFVTRCPRSGSTFGYIPKLDLHENASNNNNGKSIYSVCVFLCVLWITRFAM